MHGKVADTEHFMEKKMVENENLRRVLWREELILTGLKAALALEEKKKKVEIRVAELEA